MLALTNTTISGGGNSYYGFTVEFNSIAVNYLDDAMDLSDQGE